MEITAEHLNRKAMLRGGLIVRIKSVSGSGRKPIITEPVDPEETIHKEFRHYPNGNFYYDYPRNNWLDIVKIEGVHA